MSTSRPEQIEQRVQGLGVSVGIAIGTAVRMDAHGRQALFVRILPNRIPHEIKRLQRAVQVARHHLERIKQRMQREFGVSHGYILDPHILMLEDPLLVKSIEEQINENQVNAEWGVKLAVSRWLSAYESIQDEYLRERTSDIEDVANRLIDVLSGRRTSNLHLTQPSVVVAEDLLPTVLAELDLTNVLGIATDAGGWTSHTAIIARSLGVPSVLGLGSFAAQVHTGDPIIVDGTHDCVILNPTDATRRHYQNRLDQDERQKRDVLEHASLPAITLDSETCVLRANLELVSELPSLQKSGANGIGLFRSEFIFLNELPRLISEEEQFLVYRQLVESAGPEGVVIRTIDLGSDKIKASDLFSEERNPALGLQGIRFTLKSKDIFRDQLRAIFRAGAYGRLSVMLPKVSCVSEVRAARQLIAEVKAELEQARIPHAAHLPVGVMVEIPSAVMIIDLLAREADFLSIGSNDLIQHTLAVDRANPQVAHLYEPLHPAVIRSLKQVVDAGKVAGTLVQICGEMAANPTCAVVLLGLGLRNFSMSPSAIPNIKRLVRSVRISEAERLVTRVMELDTPRAIEQFLEGELSRSVPYFFTNSQ